MVRQARAEATRQRILDSAVDLFGEVGYGNTGLGQIIDRAEVTKGAFYYHFESKEDVAGAIIGEGRARLQAVFEQATGRPSPALENLIVATFAVAREMRTDKLVGIGNLLIQSLHQITDAGQKIYPEWASAFAAEVGKALAQGDLIENLDSDEVAETIWVSVLGCHLLSDALSDDIFTRLARAWRVLLKAIVTPPSLPYFQEFLSRAASRYIE